LGPDFVRLTLIYNRCALKKYSDKSMVFALEI